MCFPFLPAEEIPATFKQFRDLLQPSHPQPLHRLVQYIEDQSIDSSIHPPSSWSIFGFSIRTNNDTEGWHHYLNQLCARTNNQAVNLYKLIEILHKEALLVTNQCQLVEEEKLQRYQRKTFRQYQEKIFCIWDDYRAKKISPKVLLERVSRFHRPVTDDS